MLPASTKKLLPPYVSYRTFLNFIEGMQQSMPARIDRSYWGDRLSGTTGTQLVSALRFLELIDANGFPTVRLRQMVVSKGISRTELLKQITHESYAFFFQSQPDPSAVTYAQLEECFHANFQIANDVARKCIKFFISLSNDGGMKLSPFITKKARNIRPQTGTKKQTIKPEDARTEIPKQVTIVPNGINMDKLLIDKFPGFDPAWPDEIKVKWFSAFDELLKRTGNG
jgi:hypothetical protein